MVGASASAAASASNRGELWAITVELIGGHLAWGVGANGFADSIPAYLSETWVATIGVGGWIESPHNVFLQILAAGGILASLLIAALLWLFICHTRKNGLSGPFGVGAVLAAIDAGGL